MAKRKSGLHKQISSIFDGVPFPNENSSEPHRIPVEGPQGEAAAISEESLAAEVPAGEGEAAFSSASQEPFLPAAEPVQEPYAPAGPDEEPVELADFSVPETPTFEKPSSFSSPLAERSLPPVDLAAESYNYNTPVKAEPAAEPVRSEKPVDKTPPPAARKAAAGAGNTKNKVMVVVSLFLVVLLVFLLMNAFDFRFSGPSTSSAETGGEVSPATAVLTAAPLPVCWEKPELIPDKLRNPMNPVPTKSVPEAEPGNPSHSETPDIPKIPEFAIKGIVYSEEKASAVIGADIIHEGDTLQGATILKIARTYIEFEMNGHRWKQTVQ